VKKRTEIRIEIDELILVKRRPGPMQISCPVCRAEVAMVTPEQAATIAHVSTRTIYSWIEEERVHFRREPGRSLLVCAASLTALDIDPFGLDLW
jgi:hypothetical protein